jgi:hypothetical protein
LPLWKRQEVQALLQENVKEGRHATHQKTELRFPFKLTLAQRNLVAEFVPAFADRLKLDEPNQRIIDFTVAELKKLKEAAESAIQKASTRYERRPLRLVLKAIDHAITQSHRLPLADTVYQFKITLLESHPPIWRRIQVVLLSVMFAG